MTDYFIVNQDIEEFASETRNTSVEDLCESLVQYEHEDPIKLGRRIKQIPIDEIITVQQVVNIVNQKSQRDKKGRLIVSVEILTSIMDEIKSTVCGASLSRLAADGKIECSWNSETNDMEFWEAKK